MADSFFEAFSEYVDEDKYKKFLKKHKKPKELAEDLVEIGYHTFVPFLNAGCKSGDCVYDISALHDQYSETFDVMDDFKPEEKFNCHYCDREIKYGDFFTCDALTEDVESIFKKKKLVKPKERLSNSAIVGPDKRKDASPRKATLTKTIKVEKLEDDKTQRTAVKRQKSSSKLTMKFNKSIGNLSDAEKSNKDKKPTSKAELPKKDLEPVAEATVGEASLAESPVMAKKSIPKTFSKFSGVTNQLPAVASSPTSNINTPTKASSSVGVGKARMSLKASPAFSAGNRESIYQRINNTSNKKLSAILNWADMKYRLQEVEIPNLEQFDPLVSEVSLKELQDNKVENIKVASQSEFLMKELGLEMPTASELKNLAEKKEISKNILQILVQYWRCATVKKSNKLMSAWLYEENPNFEPLSQAQTPTTLVDGKGKTYSQTSVADALPNTKGDAKFRFKCFDKLFLDRNVVLHNSDFRFCILLILDAAGAHIVQYDKPTETVLSVVPADKLEESKDLRRDSLRSSMGLSRRSNSFASDPLIDKFDEINANLYDHGLLVTYRESESIKFNGPPEFFIHKYLCNKFELLPEMLASTNMELIIIWILKKLGLWMIVVEEKKPPPAPKSNLVKVLNPFKVSASGNKESSVSDMRKSQAGFSKKSQKPLFDSSVEPNTTAFTFQKYEDVKKLLDFYYAYDKPRYATLANKCSNLGKPELMEFLGVGPNSNYRKPERSKQPLIKIIKSPKQSQDNSFNSYVQTPSTSKSPERASNKLISLKQSLRKLTGGAEQSPVGAGNGSDHNNSLPSIERNKSHESHNESMDSRAARKGAARESTFARMLAFSSKLGGNSLIHSLVKKKSLSENEFSQLLALLQANEKRKILHSHESHGLGSFIYPTSFFGRLMKNYSSNHPKINYEEASHYTSKYVGHGHSVFNCFKRLIIPIVVARDAALEYKVIVVDNFDHTIILFDTNPKTREALAEKNGKKLREMTTIRAILDYISQEYVSKTSFEVDTRRYSTKLSPVPVLQHESESGIWAVYFIQQAMNGAYSPEFSESKLEYALKKLAS